LTVRSLFNGEDLRGWKGDGYRVEDGAIVCTPQGRSLVSEERFANYMFEFEFKLPPGGNNGLGIHYPGSGDAAYTAMELQILDNTADQYKNLEPGQYHGSIYKLVPAKREGLKPVGEWNFQRVTVVGPMVRVELNGQVITEGNLDEVNQQHPQHPGAKRRAGHLAWCGHGDPVSFRNLRIVELPPPANLEAVKAAGFTSLFDGKTLAGWKHAAPERSSWRAENGILRHNGKPGPDQHLWTEGEYGDFTLVFDWRWPRPGPLAKRPVLLPDGSEKKGADGQVELVEVEELDSGVYLRGSDKSQVNLWNWPCGSGEVYGYRTDGSIPPEVRAAVTPKVAADRPLGEWNRTMVTMQGELLTVVLNGRLVIDKARLPKVPTRGAIALQHHGVPIDFANLWIKAL
jgi:hypothetical protein